MPVFALIVNGASLKWGTDADGMSIKHRRQAMPPSGNNPRNLAKPRSGQLEIPPIRNTPAQPSFRSYAPEIIQYARYLGMDPVEDRALLWIALEGIDAELPSGWVQYTSKDGSAYFHNRETTETS